MRKRRLIIVGSVLILFALLGLAALPVAKRHAEAVNCSNQMHSLLFAATFMWPEDHDGHLPPDFLCMSNELITPKILICPGDHERTAAADWSSFSGKHCSYEIVGPALHKTDTNKLFFRCRIHGYAGYPDDRLLDVSGNLVRPERLW